MNDLLLEDVLITEDNEITIEEEINPQDNKPRMYYKGVFAKANIKNKNGRWYPKDVLKECYESILLDMKNGRQSIGELNHPSDPLKAAKIDLGNIAISFPELVFNEEKAAIEGKAVPTETPAGNIIKGLMKSGIKVGFSTRMAGKVKKEYVKEIGESVDVVQKPLRFISIDAVYNPSIGTFPEAVMEDTSLEENSSEKKLTLKNIIENSFN